MEAIGAGLLAWLIEMSVAGLMLWVVRWEEGKVFRSRDRRRRAMQAIEDDAADPAVLHTHVYTDKGKDIKGFYR